MNDMQIIQWHADMLRGEGNGEKSGSHEAIQRKIEEVVETSRAARRIDELDSETDDEEPVDLVDLVRERIEIVQSSYSDVDIDFEAPSTAYVDAGPIIGTVVDNVVENAIEHHDGNPHLQISVGTKRSDGSSVVLQVSDDGPGISPSEIDMLENGNETQLEHSSGLGLWLVKWVVGHFDGDIRITRLEPSGTRVEIELPKPTETDAIGLV